VASTSWSAAQRALAPEDRLRCTRGRAADMRLHRIPGEAQHWGRSAPHPRWAPQEFVPGVPARKRPAPRMASDRVHAGQRLPEGFPRRLRSLLRRESQMVRSPARKARNPPTTPFPKPCVGGSIPPGGTRHDRCDRPRAGSASSLSRRTRRPRAQSAVGVLDDAGVRAVVCTSRCCLGSWISVPADSSRPRTRNRRHVAL